MDKSLILFESYIREVKSKSCKQAVNMKQFKIVEERELNELISICSKDGVILNGSMTNFDYLKRNLKKFYCPNSLEFLKSPKPLVALASYPGSGNTWTRQLIETVTDRILANFVSEVLTNKATKTTDALILGHYTGSVYTDWNFVGSKECPKRGKVFIIKTHFIGNRSTRHRDCTMMGVSQLNFSSAIFILRNPFNAILAEFNRLHAVKETTDISFFNTGQGVAPKEMFSTATWRQFVAREAEIWRDMALYWIHNKGRPVYVLVYEHLLKSTILEMSKLMTFLNFTVWYNSLYCLSNNTTRKFKRFVPQWLTDNKMYTYALREIVNKAIKTVKISIGSQWNLTDVLNSYLLPL